MKRLKIGYFADGPWAHSTFNKIIHDDRFAIMFICVRFDSGDMVLKQYAKESNINLLRHPKVSSNDFLQSIDKYKCDIFVSMSFNQIFRKNFIEYPPLKTINCHAGMLPFYRGRNILNWVLINDESEFGITVHYVDEGIDTGDIILQRKIPISDSDDYSTLLAIAYEECANVLYESLILIYCQKTSPIVQSTIHPTGFYCNRRQAGDEIIDWNQGSREIFNFIRAICHPGPNARTFLKGTEMQISKATIINDAPTYKLIPGAIIGKRGNSILVKTQDTFIELVHYDYNGTVRIGDRFE
ncbi:MAG: methionyl-tRNA formyltransferase [Bacteroidetes bacterium]|jgi:methionyl-tRNA formyltransferase|nr:methionyl-tRNA formyltransferase [Bacteroidota bacterium]MBT7579458.1 methionyl-tRNA formyltransferase [Candidatus Neomarinimicrobiota bacterium]